MTNLMLFYLILGLQLSIIVIEKSNRKKMMRDKNDSTKKK